MAFRNGKKGQQPTAMTHEDIDKLVAATKELADLTVENTRLQGQVNQRQARTNQATSRGIHNLKDRASTTERTVSQHGRKIRLVEEDQRRLHSKADRNANEIRITGERLAETHDLVVRLTQAVGGDPSALQQAFQAGRTGDRKSFIEALRARKVSDADIARVLVILVEKGKELDLSDAELFAELYGAFASLRRIVGENTEDITELKSDVKELKRAVGGSINWVVPAIIGGVIGLIAGLLWWWHDFTGRVEIPDTPFADSIGGTGVVQFRDGISTSPADDWWVAVMFGFAIGGIAFGIAWLIVNRPGRKPKQDAQAAGTANAKHQSPKPSGPNATGNGSNGGGFIDNQLAAQNPNHPASQAKASGGGAPTRVDLLTQPGVSAPAGPATKKA